MTTALRVFAVAIAMAALVDPAMPRTVRTPVPVEVLLPAASDPYHADAIASASAVERELAGIVSTTSVEPARARIVIGSAAIQADDRPVFVLERPRDANVRLEAAEAVRTIVPGQDIRIDVALSGDGIDGRRSSVVLMDRGVVLARGEHEWRAGQQRGTLTLSVPSSAAGVQRLEVRVSTPGLEDTSASVAAVVQDRPLRVLIYEPRPSWPATFIRRVLEREPAFSVSAVARTAPRTATRLGPTPAAMSALDPSAFDVVVVGAADALSSADLNVLDAFTRERGGSVLLVPDRKLTDSVQQRFGLPATDELLLQSPLVVETSSGRVRASEILAAKTLTPAIDVLATVTHNRGDAPVMLLREHGEGRIVLSGLLDAWRYRDASADRYWRGLVADLALDAPPRLSVALTPAVARPGDRVRVVAQWRRDQLTNENGIRVPPTAAWITNASGQRNHIRLWPGDQAGAYEAVIDAPDPGAYTVSVSGEGVTTEGVLRVEQDVVHASAGSSSAVAALASLSGGAVVRSTSELRTALERLGESHTEQLIHPMRSPLWSLPFAAALLAEWLIRRRRGLR